MPSLAHTASERLAKINKRGTLPPWWLLAQVGCGVLLFLYLAFRAMSGSPEVVAAPPADDAPWATVVTDEPESAEPTTPAEPTTSEEVPAEEPGDLPTDEEDVMLGEGAIGEDELGPPGPDTSSLPAGGSTEVKALDETEVSVPNEALAVAHAATLAKFTGEYKDVPSLPGVAPTSGSTFPEASLAAPIVVSYREGAYTLSFAVDVDGSETSPRRVPTTVVLAGGAWVWTGN